MRDIEVARRVAERDPHAAYLKIKDFARYPELTDVVRSVVTHPIGPNEELSDWAVNFRNGVLRWSESDTFEPENHRIGFTQTDGDFDSFTGEWRVTPTEDTSEVCFRAAFDFGIPSLAGILDPVAEKVLKETITRIVDGLFAGSTAASGTR